MLKKKALEQTARNTEQPAVTTKLLATPADNTRSNAQSSEQKDPPAHPVSKPGLGNSILGKKVLEQSAQNTEQAAAPAQSSCTSAYNTTSESRGPEQQAPPVQAVSKPGLGNSILRNKKQDCTTQSDKADPPSS